MNDSFEILYLKKFEMQEKLIYFTQKTLNYNQNKNVSERHSIFG